MSKDKVTKANDITQTVITPEQKEISENIRKSISEQASKKLPLYRKAYSVLTNITAFVEVKIIIPPYRDVKQQTEELAFKIPYNNITSFELVASAGATEGAKFTLNLTDTTFKFLRIIYTRMYQIANGGIGINGITDAQPRIRITYGYSEEVQKRFKKNKTTARPFLTQTLDGNIIGIQTNTSFFKEEHVITGNIATSPFTENALSNPYTTYNDDPLKYLNLHEILKIILNVTKNSNEEKALLKIIKKENIKEIKENNTIQNIFKNATTGNTTEEQLSEFNPNEILNVFNKYETSLKDTASYIKNRGIKPKNALIFALKAYLQKKEKYYKDIKKVTTLIINVTKEFKIIKDNESFPITDFKIDQSTTWERFLNIIAAKCSIEHSKSLNTLIGDTSGLKVELKTYFTDMDDKTEIENIKIALNALIDSSYGKNESDLKQKQKNIVNEAFENEAIKQLDIIIISPETGSSFFDAINYLYANNLLGTYTIFPNRKNTPGPIKSLFNSGSKNTIQTGFPDVISFNAEINYRDAINSIIVSAFSTVEGAAGATDLKETKTNPELYGKIRSNLLNENPIIVNPNSGVNNSSILKKQKEILFNNALYDKMSKLQATMEILGEPALTIFTTTGRFIIIKYYEESGELSPYSGLYNISTITHKILNNKFTTELSLIKETTVSSFDKIESINNFMGIANKVYESIDEKATLSDNNDRKKPPPSQPSKKSATDKKEPSKQSPSPQPAGALLTAPGRGRLRRA